MSFAAKKVLPMGPNLSLQTGLYVYKNRPLACFPPHGGFTNVHFFLLGLEGQDVTELFAVRED